MNTDKRSLLSRIPQIGEILSHPQLQPSLERFSRDWVVRIVQHETDLVRQQLMKAAARDAEKLTSNGLLEQIVANSLRTVAEKMQPSLKSAVNGTGVILHTGLGRAPLSEAAQANLAQIADGYSTLELDLESGKRGKRDAHVEALLCDLTGAEAACVVNNNAAAVFLALNTLSSGRDAIISRGQLVEIGGSFRIPEVMEKSGANMVEVGTTNKTHFHDYERALSEDTGVICVVHQSNYRVKGFVAEVELAELVALARKQRVPLLQDLGGGVLVDLRKFGLPYEPVARESIELGVDVVTFSGDKVLGGPQAGIIVGKAGYISKIKSNPLMRVLRCDKLIYAALEPTLQSYLQESELLTENRVLRMLTEPLETLSKRIQKIKKQLAGRCQVSEKDATVQIGSGALPLEAIPSKALTLKPQAMSTEELARRLRTQTPPVIGYIRDDELYLDFRTVFEKQDALVLAALKQALP